ncbi:MAG: hypothetical protein V1873_07230 [Verrucomicrobiota bacterium]
MSLTLSQIACALGTFIVIVNVPAVVAPAVFRRVAQAFPRNRPAAWLLTAFDLGWVSWVILHAALGRFEFLKPAVYAAAPLSLLAIVFYMDELLAPRALGGLLLLIANPVLNAARWHPSEWRLVMTVVAYAWVVAGIVLILSPYRFRQVAAFMTKTDARCRALGLVRLCVGACFLFLGLKVY